MTTAIDYSITAGTLRSAFTQSTRDNGSKYWHLTNDASCSAELVKLTSDCHDTELPNDWRYSMIVSIIDSIMDYDNNTDWSDAAHCIADSLTTVYNSELFQWYADNVERIEYVNDGIDEGLISKDQLLMSQLMAGQYHCIHCMVLEILAFLELN